MKRIIVIAMLFAAVAGPATFADVLTEHDSTNAVLVSFIFPGKTNSTQISVHQDSHILWDAPLTNGAKVTGYMLDWWFYTALQKLELPFTFLKQDGKVTITAIGNLKNSSDGKWVYFVNGIRTKWYINTQSDKDIVSLKFVWEKTKTANKVQGIR